MYAIIDSVRNLGRPSQSDYILWKMNLYALIWRSYMQAKIVRLKLPLDLTVVIDVCTCIAFNTIFACVEKSETCIVCVCVCVCGRENYSNGKHNQCNLPHTVVL